YELLNLNVINLAKLSIGTPCDTVGQALTVHGTINFSGTGQIIDNSAGACLQSFAPVGVSPSTLTAAVLNESYSAFLSSGGTAPLSWACLDGLGGSVVSCATIMPAGLSFNTTNAEISGTPAVSGTFIMHFRVTDATTAFADGAVSLTVGNRPNAPVLVQPADASVQPALSVALSAV